MNDVAILVGGFLINYLMFAVNTYVSIERYGLQI